MFRRGQIWWTKYKSSEGKVVQRSLETSDRKLAAKIEAKIKTQIAEGKYFDVPMSQDKTVKDLMERYLSICSTKKARSSLRRDTMIFRKHLFPFFGGATLLTQIKPNMLADYKAYRCKAGVVSETVNKELVLLKAAYNVAIREWEWVDVNPVCRIKMEKSPEARVRYLAAEEFSRLFNACAEWIKPMVVVARYTGMRRGNLLSLKWEQVDLSRKLITLPKSKTTRYSIPMCEHVHQVLFDLAQGSHLESDNVFREPNGKAYNPTRIWRAFRTACDTVGIVDFRWHDLRHDFASQLAQSGVEILKIQKLLNHADLRMTLKYAHLAPGNLAEAVNVLDRGHNLATVKANTGKESG